MPPQDTTATGSQAAKYVTAVTIEDGWMVARCSCGWSHKLRPYQHVPAAEIYDIALDHYAFDHQMYRSSRPADAA